MGRINIVQMTIIPKPFRESTKSQSPHNIFHRNQKQHHKIYMEAPKILDNQMQSYEEK